MKILNLEWSSFPSRDREAATLVCNYLRYAGCEVIEGCIFDAWNLLRKHKPDAVFMTNIVGARLNVEVAKYIVSVNIPLYVSHAEGDFMVENIKEFVWGHNYEKEILEQLIFFWSRRNAYLSVSHFPELEQRSFVTGSAGHDRYKILSTVRPHQKTQKMRVAVCCYDFSFTHEWHSVYKTYSKETIDFFRQQCVLFDDILHDVVKANPDIDFLVKIHPGNTTGPIDAGVYRTAQLENAFLIGKDESITELLSRCDLVISYQSNTSLESWLLGKSTCVLNPLTIDWPADFYRTPFHLAQPVCKDFNELNTVIESFRKNGKIDLTVAMEENRIKLIHNIIGFADGFNHVRIGNSIMSDTMMKVDKNPSGKIYKKKLMKLSFLCMFRKSLSFLNNHSYTIRHMNQWNEQQLKDHTTKMYGAQIDFYASQQLDAAKLKELRGGFYSLREDMGRTVSNISQLTY